MPTAAGDPGLLHPEEAAALSKEAVTSRRREFAAGRSCAAQAMQDLGLATAPIAMASDRSPIWPDGVVGSISHSRTLAGAAVAARSSGILSIGLDIEEREPLPDDLIEEICTRDERRWLADYAGSATDPHNTQHHGVLAKAIFTAKEAVYKLQFPITRETFGFEMIAIEPHIPQQKFLARFADDVGLFQRDYQLSGDFWFTINHITALVSLRSLP